MNFSTVGKISLLAILYNVSPLAQADVFVRDDIITSPTASAFSICFDHDCDSLSQLHFSAEQWNSISKLFAPVADNPADERLLMAKAISKLEKMTGKMIGTDRDIGGTFPAMGKEGQMDCIDESINTTTYLRMLAAAGFLKWHTVEDRAARGLFIFQWPHSSAVVRDTQADTYFVVDSWFHDNGQPPVIIPLDTWKSGWKP